MTVSTRSIRRTPRVSYIWSPELQSLSDGLPSNVGRSSMVHGLVGALDLLDFEEYEAQEELEREQVKEDDGSDEVDEGESEQEEEKVQRPCPAPEPEEPNGSPTRTSEARATVVAPDPTLGTKAALIRYHDKSYIECLLSASGENDPENPTYRQSSPASSPSSSPRPTKICRTDPYNLSHDNPLFPTLPAYICQVASATSTACRLLAHDEADWAVCWDGGRHHAKRKEAGGFCYVNDLVLGGMLLCGEGRISVPGPRPRTRPPRVLYLDMDLHYGDGVAEAFHSPAVYHYPLETGKKPPKPPNVLTLSVHHSAPVFYPPPTPLSVLPSPDTKSPFSLSVPLSAYPSSQTYKDVFLRCIQPVYEAWDPDYIILQLGTDGLPGDRVGQYGNWSVNGEGGMRWVVEQVREWGKKVCVTGGGGYRHDNAARAWAEVMRVLLDREFEDDMPIPHHEQFKEYAPSFTMQVFEAHMRDENTKEDLDKAAEVYAVLTERLKAILEAHQV